MKRVCYLLLSLLMLSGCTVTSPMLTIIDNNFQLKQATSPLNPNVVEVEGQSYQDEYITMEFKKVENNAIFLTLTNNHNSTIRILWDEAAFVDFYGYSHRINHDGSEMNKIVLSGTSTDRSSVRSTNGGQSQITSYGNFGVVGTVEDTEKVQIPLVIPSRSKINTMVVPAGVERIIRYENVNKDKYNDSLKAQRTFDYYKSKSELSAVRLILPFEVDGNKMEYTFVFKDEFQMYQKQDLSAEVGPIMLLPLSILVLVVAILV